MTLVSMILKLIKDMEIANGSINKVRERGSDRESKRNACDIKMIAICFKSNLPFSP